MQVLVLAVQNAVDYAVLGAATSGVTLARGIGGSFGAAVFGTIFSTPPALRAARRDQRPARRAGRRRRASDGRTGRDAAGGREARLRERLRARAAAGVPRRGGRRRGAAFCSACACASARCARPPPPARASRTRWRRPSSPSSLAEIDRALGVLVSRERAARLQRARGRPRGRRSQPGRGLGAGALRQLRRRRARATMAREQGIGRAAHRGGRSASCASAAWSPTAKAQQAHTDPGRRGDGRPDAERPPRASCGRCWPTTTPTARPRSSACWSSCAWSCPALGPERARRGPLRPPTRSQRKEARRNATQLLRGR